MVDYFEQTFSLYVYKIVTNVKLMLSLSKTSKTNCLLYYVHQIFILYILKSKTNMSKNLNYKYK